MVGGSAVATNNIDPFVHDGSIVSENVDDLFVVHYDGNLNGWDNEDGLLYFALDESTGDYTSYYIDLDTMSNADGSALTWFPQHVYGDASRRITIYMLRKPSKS